MSRPIRKSLPRSLRGRRRLARLLADGWKPALADDLPIARSAAAFADRRHAGQRAGDGRPFILHPLEVASLLYQGGAPDHLIAAGVLHDVLEKSDVTEAELRRRFGPRVCALVIAVSDDDRIDGYAARKAALRQQVAHAGDEALLLFAADKLSKLRELRRETGPDRDRNGKRRRAGELRARRLRHYQRSLAMLEERLPRAPLVRGLREELRRFMRERASLASGS